MKALNITLFWHVSPRLAPYSPFDIGSHKPYIDQGATEQAVKQLTQTTYLPFLKKLDKHLKKQPETKLALAITASAIEWLSNCSPEVLQRLQNLAETNAIELLGTTAQNSLSFFYQKEIHDQEIKQQRKRIKKTFGQRPTLFYPAELAYNNKLGEDLQADYDGIITQAVPFYLHNQHPNQVFAVPNTKAFGLLLSNQTLTQQLINSLHQKPGSLSPKKYRKALLAAPGNQITLTLDIEQLRPQTPGHDPLKWWNPWLKAITEHKSIKLNSPKKILQKQQAKEEYPVRHSISGMSPVYDLTPWKGNHLQEHLLLRIQELHMAMQHSKSQKDRKRFATLQNADYLYHMYSGKQETGKLARHQNPFPTPHHTYRYLMHMLADFELSIKQEP